MIVLISLFHLNLETSLSSLPKSLMIDPNKIEIGKIIGQGEFAYITLEYCE